jgi:hypothetical protein
MHQDKFVTVSLLKECPNTEIRMVHLLVEIINCDWSVLSVCLIISVACNWDAKYCDCAV